MPNPPKPREHGTDRGYAQHRNRNDWPACAPCVAAHTARTRADREAAREQRYAPDEFPRWITRAQEEMTW